MGLWVFCLEPCAGEDLVHSEKIRLVATMMRPAAHPLFMGSWTGDANRPSIYLLTHATRAQAEDRQV